MFYEHKNSKLNLFSYISKELNFRVLQLDRKVVEWWAGRHPPLAAQYPLPPLTLPLPTSTPHASLHYK